MELPGRKRMMLFSGSANQPLAEEVARLLGIPLGGVQRDRFANGEIYVRFEESVRGADCFVLQSHSKPVNFHIMEQLIMLDALHRASAKRITAVVPFYGYARQDKKHLAREPITARLDGRPAGGRGRRPHRVDGPAQRPDPGLHGQALRPPDRPARLLPVPAGDGGGLHGHRRPPTRAGCALPPASPGTWTPGWPSSTSGAGPTSHNESAALQVVGDVDGLNAVIIDDMIDTGGTVVAAAELLREAGAVSVRALATHGVLSPPAERFRTDVLDEVVITNTLPVPEDAAGLAKLKVLSIGPILADALRAIFTEESVSALFMGENA